MKDTAPEVEARFLELLGSRSGSQRVEMACGMFDAAKAVVEANLRDARPDISSAELRVALFDRLYFEDFRVEDRQRIVAALRARFP